MPKESKEGKSNFLFYFLPLFLAQKGSSIAFAFLLKTWQQHENIVAWSGRNEIACRKKNDMLILDMLTSVHKYSFRFVLVLQNTVSLFYKYKLKV